MKFENLRQEVKRTFNEESEDAGEFVMDQVLALEEVWKIEVGHIEEDI